MRTFQIFLLILEVENFSIVPLKKSKIIWFFWSHIYCINTKEAQ